MYRLLIFAFLLFACSKTEKNSARLELEVLTNFMKGSFSNKDQLADKYSYTILSTKELWPGSESEKWLLENQSLSINPDDIFRQRIYHIKLTDDNIIQVDILAAPAKASFETIKEMNKDSLIIRSGCSIFFRKEKDEFIGATFGDQCETSYQNASHVVEQFKISKNQFINWVSGYNDAGDQVWGAEEQALIFKRL
ncbi:MAG: chromophore lyase CpcT/CpeT [Calditrichaeota bacterium]|nr:chromophore lyase CpcT/CpeT [Calditrichota bacterium]